MPATMGRQHTTVDFGLGTPHLQLALKQSYSATKSCRLERPMLEGKVWVWFNKSKVHSCNIPVLGVLATLVGACG